MTLWTVRLGLRLTFSGDRGGRLRLLMMVAGVAVGVGLLLAVAGVLPAAAERIGKTAARDVADGPDGVMHEQGARAALSVGFWRGRELRIFQVEVIGPAVAPPLGVPRTPRPGEVFVSPALARALVGRHGSELAPRLPGRVAGTVDRVGLVGPEELYAVAGATVGALDRAGPGGVSPRIGPGFARPGDGGLFASQGVHANGTGMGQEDNAATDLLPVLGLAGVGVVVPLLILIGTSTRLSAASRERRVSAMRLVGASARQLRLFGAVEAAVVGTVGAVLGAGLFLLVRAPGAALLPITDGVYAGDVAPPAIAWLAVLVGVPVLAAAAGALAVRRAVAAPLAVRRQAAPARAGAGLLVPLGVGLALLVVAYADRPAVRTGAWHGRVLLLAGAALCLIGLAIGAAALSRLAGQLLSRFGGGLASQLAGRRLAVNPGGAARAISGTALVVVLLGWMVALLPALVAAQTAADDEMTGALRPGTVVVTLRANADVPATVAALHGLAGVGQVTTIGHLRLLPPGMRPQDCCGDGPPRIAEQPPTAVVADCAALGRVLRAPLDGCRRGVVQYLGGETLDAATIAATGRLVPIDSAGEPMAVRALSVPAPLTAVSIPRTSTVRPDGLLVGGDLLIPPSMVPADLAGSWFPHVLVATDGRPDTIEAVRASLGQQTPFPPLTAAESVALARSASTGYAQAALLIVLAVVLAGGLSLAVTTVDGLRESRRAHGALIAMGTPTGLLRRSVLLSAGLPLLLNIGLAVLITAGTSWLFLRLTIAETFAPALPWAAYGAIAAVAVLAGLLANVAVLPFIRAAVRPDALRTE